MSGKRVSMHGFFLLVLVFPRTVRVLLLTLLPASLNWIRPRNCRISQDKVAEIR